MCLAKFFKKQLFIITVLMIIFSFIYFLNAFDFYSRPISFLPSPHPSLPPQPFLPPNI